MVGGDAELTSYTEHTITRKRELRKEILRVRQNGWCVVDQEHEIGLRSASAPVKDSSEADRCGA